VFSVADFHGLRTKVCRTFYIVSSATQGQPWPMKYTVSFNEPIVPR